MKSILAILILGAVFLFCRPAFCADVVSIALIYPQASNAPKREAQKKEPPLVVKDKIPIDVTGISREQLNHPELYVEYFLDDKLIYTSEERKGKGKNLYIYLCSFLFRRS